MILSGAMSEASSGWKQVTSRSIASDRPSCRSKSRLPVNRVNTTDRLIELRQVMASTKLVRPVSLKAYIITSDDEHQVDSLI